MYKKLLIFFAFLFVCVGVSSQTKSYVQYRERAFLKSYGIDEIGNAVRTYCVSEYSAGLILVASTDGLDVYNGSTWEFYPPYNNSGLEKIAVDGHGRVFASGLNDMGYFFPDSKGNFKYNSFIDKINVYGNKILGVVCQGDSIVYFFNSRESYCYDYNKFDTLNIGQLETFADCGDYIVAVEQSGMMYRIAGKNKHLLFDLTTLNVDLSNFKVLRTQDNILLIDRNKKMYRFKVDRAKFNSVMKPEEFEFVGFDFEEYRNLKISNIIFERNNNIIAASTNDGIFIFDIDGKLVEHIDETTGLPSSDIKNIYFDRKHNLWAAYSGGVSKIELFSNMVYYSQPQNIIQPVYCCKTFNGKQYAGCTGGIFMSYADVLKAENTQFRRIDSTKSENTCWNFGVVDGKLLACMSKGLYQIDGDKVYKLNFECKSYAVACHKNYPGKIFIASYCGFFVADVKNVGGKLEIINPFIVNGLDKPIWNIAFSDNGAIWISTLFDGLVHINVDNNDFKNCKVESINKNCGIVNGRQLSMQFLDNHIYINDSIFKRAVLPNSPNFTAEDITFVPDTLRNKEIDFFIYGFVFNPISGDADVYGLKKSGLLKRLSLNKFNFRPYNYRRPVKYIHNMQLNDNILWICSNIGLIKSFQEMHYYYDPANRPFNILISKVYVGDSLVYNGIKHFEPSMVSITTRKYQTDNDFLVLSSDKNIIRFNVTATSYEQEDANQFSYFLEGAEKNWTPWTSENYREYVNLSPGTYVFHATAKNCAGKSCEIAEYKFKILAPFYLSKWAIAAYMLIALFLIYLLIKTATVKLKTENQKLEKLAATRNAKIIDQNRKLKRLSLVASQTTNSVAILDADGNFQWVNDWFKNIRGYNLEEYCDVFGPNFFLVEQRTGLESEYLLQDARTNFTPVSYQTYHINSRQERVWVQANLTPVFDENKKLTNWVLVETDITRLKKADEEITMQASALTEAYMKLHHRQEEIEKQRDELESINNRIEIGFKQIKQQNNTIKSSLTYAKTIQNSILPMRSTISKLFDNFILYMPKDIVSGDFYWFGKVSEKSYIIAVADCTGHGVPGAFMSLIGNNLLNEIVLMQGIVNPKDIILKLNENVISVLKQDITKNNDGMDVCLCRLDQTEFGYDVTFSGTGCFILVYDSITKQIRRLRGARHQIGLVSQMIGNSHFNEQYFKLKFNDMLVMLSDGIIDQNNTERKRFGTNRFMEFISNRHSRLMPEIEADLKAELLAFMDGEPQRDDITVIGLRIKENS